MTRDDSRDFFKGAREQLIPPLQLGEIVLQNCRTGETFRYPTRQAYLRDNCDLYQDDAKSEMLHDRNPGLVREPNEAIERFRTMIRRMRA